MFVARHKTPTCYELVGVLIMKISNIKIGKRFRKDLGDLTSLKNSIKDIGLLQPIVVDEKNNLIAGYRRLLAHQKLGLKDIKVNVVKIENALQGEYDENTIRKNFSPTESVDILRALESYQGKKGLPPNLGRREKAVKITGYSKGSLDKAKAVVDFGDKKLIEKMDRTGNIDASYNEIKREKRINEQVEAGKKAKEVPVEFYNEDFNKVKLEKNSVDLIITDPPYPKEFLHCWKELAIYADKVLKPSGFLVAYSGQLHMKEAMELLSTQLEYYWTFCLYLKGSTQIVSARNITCRWKPIFIYQKKPFKKTRVMEDYIISEQREKDGHDWQQSESGAMALIDRFSKPGDVVLDPMMGAGTFPYIAHKMKRKAIGIEIDKKYYFISKSKYD